MKQFDWKKGISLILPHIIAIAVFLVIAVIYCEPILENKTLSQEDVAGWTGMVHQMQQYKETHGHFPLWNNRMFGGMPGYQIALESQNKLSIDVFHKVLTLGLPAPIAFFFLLCLGFYFLSQVLKVNPWIGMVGALAYGYASFSPILVSAGHETEIQAMGYVPFLLGALILLYEKKYKAGTALTALFSGLFIGMNHLQISYYFVIVATCMTVAYALRWIKSRQYKHLLLACALTLLAGAVGALANATILFTTYDYSHETMRNGGQRLGALESQGGTSPGLPIDYAFNWSYGKAETITLLVPNAFGGSSKTLTQEANPEEEYDDARLPPIPKKSDGLLNYFKSYWGDQPSTSGPVYLGAVMCFLFLFSLIYLRSPHKKWLIILTLLAILMSWGRNFAFFNDFLFYHLPLYNKFRVPSMILFIPQLTCPILVVLCLQQLFYGEALAEGGRRMDEKAYILRRFKMALVLIIALLALCACLYTVMDYRSHADLKTAEQLNHAIKQDPSFGKDLLSAAADDRQALFGADLFRSFLLIGAAALLLWGYLRERIKRKTTIIVLGLLVFGDLITVDMRYLGYNSYMDKEESATSINATAADSVINLDHSWFRVLNLADGPVTAWQEANTSYFHNSVGGYHPAKLSVMDNLITFQLNKRPLNRGVLDMLNTKYLILSDSLTQEPVAVTNPGALGPCWLVRGIRWVDGPWTAMEALDDFNPKDTAIIERSWEYKIPALSPAIMPPLSALPAVPILDTTGYVRMINNDNDIIRYVSSEKGLALAVFSDIYYARGWKAYVDGVERPIIRVDYALRGLALPPGRHYIRFEFRPASYYMGERVASICTWLVFILVTGILIREVIDAVRLKSGTD